MSQAQLLESYILRVRWESDVLATAVVKRLAEAMGGGTAAEPRRQEKTEPGKLDRVSSDTFLQMMGIKLHGHKPNEG